MDRSFLLNLTKMTEDERKICQFWQLTDDDYFDSCIDIVRDMICDENENASEDSVDKVIADMTADEKAEIGRIAQNIESEEEDRYWDGFADTYQQLIRDYIEEKLRLAVKEQC